ncbi:hypothetical protein VPHF27_0038 [Vibrio phage F27]|nr:putative coil containing protein [Vibrio phage 115E34-1]
MKAQNLKAKPYIIPVSDGENLMLKPAGKPVDVPKTADIDYLKKLSLNGMISLTGELEEDIEDAVIVEPKEDDERELLETEYEILSGKKADGRWSDERLKEEIENLSE